VILHAPWRINSDLKGVSIINGQTHFFKSRPEIWGVDPSSMTASMLEAFPSIKEGEFAEACRALESRCHDALDGTDWLSVNWTGEELVIKQSREIGNRHSTAPDVCDDELEDLTEESGDDDQAVSKHHLDRVSRLC